MIVQSSPIYRCDRCKHEVHSYGNAAPLPKGWTIIDNPDTKGIPKHFCSFCSGNETSFCAHCAAGRSLAGFSDHRWGTLLFSTTWDKEAPCFNPNNLTQEIKNQQVKLDQLAEEYRRITQYQATLLNRMPGKGLE